MVLQGREKFARFFDRRGKVRIGEQNYLAACLQRAVTHAVALAPVRAVRQNAQLREFTAERFGHLGGAIRGPVVHHNYFRAPALTLDITGDLFQCCGQAQLFVKCRNDDGQLGDGLVHQIHASFQPWLPRRGTNRQGSLRSELNLSPCLVSSSNTWSSSPPTGTIIRPPSANCCAKGSGTWGAAAATTMPS